jgi:hypothetical protein
MTNITTLNTEVVLYQSASAVWNDLLQNIVFTNWAEIAGEQVVNHVLPRFKTLEGLQCNPYGIVDRHHVEQRVLFVMNNVLFNDVTGYSIDSCLQHYISNYYLYVFRHTGMIFPVKNKSYYIVNAPEKFYTISRYKYFSDYMLTHESRHRRGISKNLYVKEIVQLLGRLENNRLKLQESMVTVNVSMEAELETLRNQVNQAERYTW